MNAREESIKTQYLRLIGRLYPDNRLHLRPGYLTDDPHGIREDPNSILIAELYDANDKLLGRHRLIVRPYCVPGGVSREMSVRGKIPFPPSTSIVRFFRDTVLIHEIQVNEGKPQVRISWQPSDSVNGKQTINWVGEHSQNQPLQYFLRYTHTNGKTWQRIGWRTEETKQEIDFDQLPGGKQCRVAVVATDGVNTVMVESESFSVPVKPCKAMIFAPEDGAKFAEGEPVLLRGQGFYLEENSPETEVLTWVSSQDGELGVGMILQTPDLSPGFHRITLTAGTSERAGKATISIEIGKRSES